MHVVFFPLSWQINFKAVDYPPVACNSMHCSFIYYLVFKIIFIKKKRKKKERKKIKPMGLTTSMFGSGFCKKSSTDFVIVGL